MRRALFLWIAMAAGCSGGNGAPRAADAAGAPAAFRFPVTFVEAVHGTITESVILVGDVETARRAILAFERPGRVTNVAVDAGDRVATGMPLARLDDAVLEAELRSARAAAAAERVDADFAASELQRARELGDTIAQSERDRWSSEMAAREARAARGNAEVARLEAMLAQGVLRAPFPGTVVARHVTLGSHAATGAAAFELVDLEALEVWLELPAAVAARAQDGDRVLLETGVAGASLELTLDTIVPSAEPGTRTFRAIARFAGADAPGLRPGAFVRAHLALGEAAGILVPNDALLENAHGAALIVAEGGDDAVPPSARMVPVRILARGATSVAVEQIEPGTLTAGARVVVTGADNVFPGAPLLLQAHRAAL
jgi:RND family efflux transporter MFP subunit